MHVRSALVFVISLAAGCAIPIVGAHASDRPVASSAKHKRAAAPRAEHGPIARKREPRRETKPKAAAPAPRKTAVAREPAPQRPAGAPSYALSTVRPALSTVRSGLPAHRSPPGTCYAQLDDAGVHYERVEKSKAHGVQYPTRLHGPIGGVEIVQHDQRAPQFQSILDCRLALAVLTWAPSLRRAGVRRIEHYSIYRPGARVSGGGQKSGHSTGMALDAARFHLDGGQVVDVLTDWEDRDRGDAPCPRRDDEPWQSRLLRGLVCEAVDRNLFQVVITPHHDRAHENHVHLELRPEVDWSYVR
jgi:hypothetical protein